MADIGNFLKAQTGPLPNWVWGVVIVAGVGAAYVLPKFFGGSSSNSSQTSQAQQGANGASGGGGAAGSEGLGLAIDPTTGLPYAVEGLVPSGASVPASPLPPVPAPPTPTPVSPPPPKKKKKPLTNAQVEKSEQNLENIEKKRHIPESTKAHTVPLIPRPAPTFGNWPGNGSHPVIRQGG